MKEANGNSNMGQLPAIIRDNEIEIPTKKLNTIQQKNYREYADKVCRNIRTMLLEIKEIVLSNLRTSNIDEVRNQMIAESPEIKEVSKELAELNKKITAVSNKSLKIMTDYESAKIKLTTEMESKIASLKNDEMLPLTEAFNNIKEKTKKASEKKKAFYNALSSDNLKIFTEKQYANNDNDDILSKSKRSIDISYPSLDPIDCSEIRFINRDVVQQRLEQMMKPAIDEFKLAEIKLESMEQDVREVMMFNESQMNEAFKKLFAFRNSIRQKHLEVVRNVYSSDEE